VADSRQPTSSRTDVAAILASIRRDDRPHGGGGSSDTERAIMAATERLLTSRPIHDLTVAEIVREARISRGTFYFWFSSKYAIVNALVAQAMQEMFDVFEPLMAAEPGTLPDLQRGVEASARVWVNHRYALRAAMQHWHTDPDLQKVLFAIIAWMSEKLGDAIEEGRAAGLLPAGPPGRQLAATTIWSSQYCLYIAGLDEGDPNMASEKDILDTLVWMWTTGLRGTAPSVSGALPSQAGPQ
jgi:AcrR family transcriptional regulator